MPDSDLTSACQPGGGLAAFRAERWTCIDRFCAIGRGGGDPEGPPPLSSAGLPGATTSDVGGHVIDVRAGLRRSRRAPTRMVADVVVLGTASVVIVAVCRSPQITAALPRPVTDQVVAVIAAVAATGSAVLGAIIARLAGDLRARWIGAALVLYSFVVVPLTVFVIVPGDDQAQRGARLLANLVTVALLVTAVRPPRRVGPIGTWSVLAELGRLNTIPDTGGLGPTSGTTDIDCRVEPVLNGLAIPRRSAGAAVEVDIDPDLRVRGGPAVLAQIVTNLLAHCGRHASGARVVLHAHRQGDDAVVEVRDEGPGLPPAVEPVALERGVQDAAGGGSGSGHYISGRLVEQEGGTLAVRTVENPRGCLAVVTVPRATSHSVCAADRSST